MLCFHCCSFGAKTSSRRRTLRETREEGLAVAQPQAVLAGIGAFTAAMVGQVAGFQIQLDARVPGL